MKRHQTLSLPSHVPERSSPSRVWPFRRLTSEKGKGANAKATRGPVRPPAGRPRAAQQLWSRQTIIGVKNARNGKSLAI